MDLTGACNCSAVAFSAKGAPFCNVFCHCRACSRARGVSPVHLVAFEEPCFQITKGEEFVKVSKGLGRMTHAFCSECGAFIYQCPAGAGFRALMPTTFHIETVDPSVPCGVSCKLPPELLPTAHVHYENRLMDACDDLPKYTAFTDSPQLKNDGTPL
mmetsp:Transcript_54015/g.157704  ORF Transcript_54015/g.157704 Transcript_54015/m.157704 type:complete len:157 (+) Transcript_54015:60-530(+)